MTQALASSGLQGQGGKMGPNGKPQVKPDINTIATDVFQLKKMLFSIMRHQNIELPPDVLDGPNRDPMTGAPAVSPSGGSDVQPGASMQPGGGAGGPDSAIKPIEPMAGAFPAPPGGMGGGGGGGMGGMGKASSDQLLFRGRVGQECSAPAVLSKAAAVALICQRRRQLVETGELPRQEYPEKEASAPTAAQLKARQLLVTLRRSA